MGIKGVNMATLIKISKNGVSAKTAIYTDDSSIVTRSVVTCEIDSRQFNEKSFIHTACLHCGEMRVPVRLVDTNFLQSMNAHFICASCGKEIYLVESSLDHRIDNLNYKLCFQRADPNG